MREALDVPPRIGSDDVLGGTVDALGVEHIGVFDLEKARSRCTVPSGTSTTPHEPLGRQSSGDYGSGDP